MSDAKASIILWNLAIFYRYGSPILSIKWHKTLNSDKPKLITADKHIVRIWDPETVRNSHISVCFCCNLIFVSCRNVVVLRLLLAGKKVQ